MATLDEDLQGIVNTSIELGFNYLMGRILIDLEDMKYEPTLENIRFMSAIIQVLDDINLKEEAKNASLLVALKLGWDNSG